jgi:Type VI secretion system/phage-baseplate injector OB domain
MVMNRDLNRHVGKYYGKYSGDVTDNEDAEQMGRIKVKVPTMFGADREVIARPCFPTAHFYVPPVGAKVWVEFEAGDPSYPLYVGIWYPTGTVPPQAAVTPPDNRVIQTPSGHTIELMDKEGEEKIVIRHKDNSFISLDKTGSVLVSNKNGSHIFLNAEQEEATITEQHGNFIRMKDDGVSVVNVNGAVIEMKDDSVKVIAKDAVTISTKDLNIETSTVNLGQGSGQGMGPGSPGEKALLAESFLLQVFASHMHPSAMGPTGPPIPTPPGVPPYTLILSKSVKIKP